MNIYDFDKTICKDDSETDFFFFALVRYPINLLAIPYYFVAFIMKKNGKITLEEYRRRIYHVLKPMKNIEAEIKLFWKKRKKKILPWYLAQQKEDDLIISATPDFIIEPILKEMKIQNYIVSKFDLTKREVVGKLCYGEEKKKEFLKRYRVEDADSFYSDSLSDRPMLELAKQSFLVINYQIQPYKKDAPQK